MKHDARPPASEPACVGNAVLLYFKFPPLPPPLACMTVLKKETRKRRVFFLFCHKKVRARSRTRRDLGVFGRGLIALTGRREPSPLS